MADMNIIVQKYGGTSVGDLQKIEHVASRVAEAAKKWRDRIVGSCFCNVPARRDKAYQNGELP